MDTAGRPDEHAASPASDTPQPEWLTADELASWLSVLAFLETVPTALDAQLKRDTGINRFEYSVLAMLSAEPDRSLSMTELSQAALGSLSRLSHAVGRLENRGWVERCDSPEGTRYKRVRLTDDGVAAVADAAPGHVAEVRRVLLDPLGDDFASFAELARRVFQLLDPERSDRLDHVIDRIVAAAER